MIDSRATDPALIDPDYLSETRTGRQPSPARKWSVLTDIDVLYVGFVLGHGGDAIQMVDLAAEVARRGLRVRIVVPELPTTIVTETRAKALGLDIVRTPWIRSDAHGSRQNLANLLRTFRHHRAGIYHLHTGDVCLPRLVLLTLGLMDVRPVVVTTHSPYATLTPGDARSRHWAHAAKQNLNVIVCPSDHSRKLQMNYGVPPEKVVTIRNSVDTERFGKGDGAAAYRALGIDPSARLAIFSSRLDVQKRPADAIRAFALVANEFPDLHLIMAGRGEEEARLKELAAASGLSGRIRFPGFQSNIPDWLAAAAVWLFPTESENFSLALLEALAAGCPVVSTSCQGNDEVLEHDRNAAVCPIGDVEAMANAIRRILSDDAYSDRLRAGARRTAAEYSVANMVNAYARCYNACAGYPFGP